MIVSVDTNILIQASLTDGLPRKVLMYLCKNYELVLSSSVKDEYEDVIRRDYIISKYKPIDILEIVDYKIIETPKFINKDLFNIRDNKDYIILYTLINSDTDVFITNDKDFEDVNIGRPRIITSKQFFEEFMQWAT